LNSDLWLRMRALTPARIGLGRAGGSLPTRPLLEFELAHARARDAVHTAMDGEGLARELAEAGFSEPAVVRSRARDRMEYLLRPDLGRMLDEESRERLRALAPNQDGCEWAVVIADGLSAVAPQKHAVAVLKEVRSAAGFALHPGSAERHGTCGMTEFCSENVPVVVANQARVALGDEIGEMLGARVVLVLIGERPGLSSPDSLGIYLTWNPRVGRTDAERNCISNVRPEGLPYEEAARRLCYLLSTARRLGLSGVALKDDSGDSVLP
jgi:ethanolamine ammonia-lyase small subunit